MGVACFSICLPVLSDSEYLYTVLLSELFGDCTGDVVVRNIEGEGEEGRLLYQKASRVSPTGGHVDQDGSNCIFADWVDCGREGVMAMIDWAFN